MNLPKETVAVIAVIALSGLLFSSLVAFQPEARQVTFGTEPATPYSADHARAQATARDEEAAPTF